MLRAQATVGSVMSGSRVLEVVGGLAAVMAHMLATRSPPPEHLLKTLDKYCADNNLPWAAWPNTRSQAKGRQYLIDCGAPLLQRDYLRASIDLQAEWVVDWQSRARACLVPESCVVDGGESYRAMLVGAQKWKQTSALEHIVKDR